MTLRGILDFFKPVHVESTRPERERGIAKARRETDLYLETSHDLDELLAELHQENKKEIEKNE